MQKAKWGVLSTARIGTNVVIPAMQVGERSEILAIASRDHGQAQLTARSLGIPRAYGSYEELLADPDIEAIYNPLPNHLHVPWTIQALQAGKHVLCEKPISLDAAEAGELLVAASSYPELHVMEAFMYRFHPQWERVHHLLREGAIGELRTIAVYFSYFNEDPADIRNQPRMGGGGLLDIGCYPISLSRWLFGEEPQRVLASVEDDPNFGIDRLVCAILEYDRGTATFTVGTQLAGAQWASLHGTRGWIQVETPFNPPLDRSPSLRLQTLTSSEEMVVEAVNQYTLQGDLFSMAVLGQARPPTPLTDAVANMAVIDAIFTSAQSGGWVELPFS